MNVRKMRCFLQNSVDAADFLLCVVGVQAVGASVLGTEVLEGAERLILGAQGYVMEQAGSLGGEELELLKAVAGGDG